LCTIVLQHNTAQNSSNSDDMVGRQLFDDKYLRVDVAEGRRSDQGRGGRGARGGGHFEGTIFHIDFVIVRQMLVLVELFLAHANDGHYCHILSQLQLKLLVPSMKRMIDTCL